MYVFSSKFKISALKTFSKAIQSISDLVSAMTVYPDFYFYFPFDWADTRAQPITR